MHMRMHTRKYTHTLSFNLCTNSSLHNTPQGDNDEQKMHRGQRNAGWSALMPWWYPARLGGKDCTFRSMPDHIKIDLVNHMAKSPALWTAAETIKKTDTKVSTWRHELSKKPSMKRTPVHTRTRTNTHTHIC
jgi:hypothetical protein